MSDAAATKPDASGERRHALRNAVIAAVILLLLLLCCWTLFWPVPEDAADEGSTFERGSASAGDLTVKNVRTQVLFGSNVSTKGVLTVYTFDVRSAGRDIVFDAGFVGLQLDAVMLPPVASPEAGAYTSIPAVLARGRTERVSVVFAVPRGSIDTTLVVRSGLTRDSAAPSVPIHLDTRGAE